MRWPWIRRRRTTDLLRDALVEKGQAYALRVRAEELARRFTEDRRKNRYGDMIAKAMGGGDE